MSNFSKFKNSYEYSVVSASRSLLGLEIFSHFCCCSTAIAAISYHIFLPVCRPVIFYCHRQYNSVRSLEICEGNAETFAESMHDVYK